MPSVFYQFSRTTYRGLLGLCLSGFLLFAQNTFGIDEKTDQAPEAPDAGSDKVAAEDDQAALMQKALLKIYRSNLLKKTYQHVEYPESSIERHEEGDVILLVEVRRDGKVKRIDYEAKAPARALNIAARTAVKKAHPFSEAPVGLDGDTFEIAMPIRFRLTE